MLRIGAMNMMTHGVENPDIQYKDSLSEQNADTERYSLILFTPLAQIDLLKKAILARAFRGELGTGNPNDPSALDLLKQSL